MIYDTIMRKLKLPRIAVLAALVASPSFAGDFKQAVVILAGGSTTPRQKAAQMLVEEIEKRTQLRLKISTEAPAGAPTIYLKVAAGGKPESFTLTSTDNSIVVTGADDRGVVFGTGYLLRQFRMSRQKLELDANLKISTANVLLPHRHRPCVVGVGLWPIAQLLASHRIFRRGGDFQISVEFQLLARHAKLPEQITCAEHNSAIVSAGDDNTVVRGGERE